MRAASRRSAGWAGPAICPRRRSPRNCCSATRPCRRRADARGWQSACDVLAQPGAGLSARGEVELVEDVGDVALHGVRADVERTRDQLVAVAGGDALEHFALAAAEL